MTDQARKHAIGLAGEFLVAGELLRRGIHAAVTYGNAKKADVVAINGDKATAPEVKTTSADKWVLGGSLPDDPAKMWVLVYLPVVETEPPQYFVITGAELHTLLLPGHEAYLQRYREKRGKEFTGPGVVSIQRSTLEPEHAGAWSKVVRAVSI